MSTTTAPKLLNNFSSKSHAPLVPEQKADQQQKQSEESDVRIDIGAAVLNLEKCFTVTPPPLDFVWPGFLAGTIGALCAAGSTGKSFWSLEAALCIGSSAANAELLQLDITNHGRVVLLNAEDAQDLLWHRLHDIGKHMSPLAMKEAVANVSIASLVGMGATITSDQWVESIIELGRGARLIVLDTHSRWAAGVSENDNSEQTQVLMRYERIAKATTAAILFLHHVSKSIMLDGRQDEQGAARGASAITDAARYQAFMHRMGAKEKGDSTISEEDRKNIVIFGAAKVNGGALGEQIWYRRVKGGVLLPMRSRAQMEAVSALRPVPLTVDDRAEIKRQGLARTMSNQPCKEIDELIQEVSSSSLFAGVQ